MAWATEKTLWEDAMAKAPNSARPPHNLAWGHYDLLGRHDKAMELYEKSFLLEWHSLSHRADALYGMAGIYLKKGEYHKAADLYKKALKIPPGDEMSYKQLVVSLIKLGKWDEALTNINTLILRRPNSAKYLNLKGFILLKLKKPKDAISCLRKCLKLDPDYRKALINLGASLCFMGEYERAELYLRHAGSLNPKEILALLWLIETNLKIGDNEDVDRYMDKLFGFVAVNGFASIAERLSDHTLMVPVSGEAVVRKIAAKLEEKSEEIVQLEAHLSGQSK